jgi:putative transcriptional regulator
MSSHFIKARKRPDGKLVQVMDDGSEREFEARGTLADAPVPPDEEGLTDEQLSKMRRVPRSKTMRRALGLTQEQFSERYSIPLGTLRDWEQGRSEPDAPARAYLQVIAKDPEFVRQALAS